MRLYVRGSVLHAVLRIPAYPVESSLRSVRYALGEVALAAKKKIQSAVFQNDDLVFVNQRFTEYTDEEQLELLRALLSAVNPKED